MRAEHDSPFCLCARILLYYRLLLHYELRTKSFDPDTLEGSIRSNSNDIKVQFFVVVCFFRVSQRNKGEPKLIELL